MKTYLKCILLFLTPTILLIVSCNEEPPIYLTATPNAQAGTDQLVEIYDTVYLDGSLSTKSENVEYIWTFDYKPPGSKTVFSDSSIQNPTFIADAGGFYSVQLVLKSKEMYSEPDYTVIQSILKKSEEYFPKKVGNKWKYKVSDQAGTVTDTITIEVVGTTNLQNGEPASIWVYSRISNIYPYPYSIIDTLYLVNRGDTLVYYHQNNPDPLLGYIVPFQVGDSLVIRWNNTVVVMEENSMSIDIGTFQVAYQMKHLIPGWSPMYSEFYSYNWIVPYIGLVKMDLYEYSFNLKEEHWELIWYDLVE
jgi:hypothetical protein